MCGTANDTTRRSLHGGCKETWILIQQDLQNKPFASIMRDQLQIVKRDLNTGLCKHWMRCYMPAAHMLQTPGTPHATPRHSVQHREATLQSAMCSAPFPPWRHLHWSVFTHARACKTARCQYINVIAKICYAVTKQGSMCMGYALAQCGQGLQALGELGAGRA